MEKHAAYCGTKEIYSDMETAAKSLIANSDVDVVHFIIEDDIFPFEVPEIIQFHNLSNQTFFTPDNPNINNRFTYMVMIRIALCYIFEDLDYILSLDCDTVVNKNISKLWNLPIEDSYFAGVYEYHKSKNGLLYCNQGVTLYNLNKMRQGKAAECIDVLNRRKYEYVEQDVVNYLCQGYIYDMPTQYNVSYWTVENEFLIDPYITHFACIPRNQWTQYESVLKWKDTSWDEVMDMHKHCCKK